MILLGNSRQDPLLAVVAEAVSSILASGNVVAPLDVLVHLEMVDPDAIDVWRGGGLPYLERGITSGLSRVARVLRLVREHALAIGLEPVPAKYLRRGKGPNRRLRFSKRGDEESEAAYGTHFIRKKG